jgi:hypothetical protein
MEEVVLTSLLVAHLIKDKILNVLNSWEVVVQNIVKELHQMQQLLLLVEREYAQILPQQVIKIVTME